MKTSIETSNIVYAVPLVVEGQVSKPIKYQVQGLCPEYRGPQSARVFEEEIEKWEKHKVLRPHVNSTQPKEPSKIKTNVNFEKGRNSEKKDKPCLFRSRIRNIIEIILAKVYL